MFVGSNAIPSPKQSRHRPSSGGSRCQSRVVCRDAGGHACEATVAIGSSEYLQLWQRRCLPQTCCFVTTSVDRFSSFVLTRGLGIIRRNTFPLAEGRLIQDSMPEVRRFVDRRFHEVPSLRNVGCRCIAWCDERRDSDQYCEPDPPHGHLGGMAGGSLAERSAAHQIWRGLGAKQRTCRNRIDLAPNCF